MIKISKKAKKFALLD